MSGTFVLTLHCPERPGIVHALTAFLVDHHCDITEHQQFDDQHSGQLFLRTCFRSEDPSVELSALSQAFEPVAAAYRMTWQLHDAEVRDRVLVMVSKADHCLNDLLYRWRTGTLGADIVAVVSNHLTLEPMVTTAGLPFVHIPVTADTRAAGEQRLRDAIRTHGADTVVLARYMQILSDDLAKELDGRAINIHHSFLPSFAGARPYHQAYSRGVEMVGATAHYVTADLDEGPIIDQAVAEIDHRHTAADLMRIGRDAECRALARAVSWHAEHRILINGNRTVIFR